MKRNIDILNGSIADKVLIFALPLALTSILQQCFNAADVAVVGQFAGSNAMAAVGSNTALVGLIVNGFTGIALGANVVISKYTGQRNADGISRCVHTTVLFSLLGGVILTILGELLAPIVLSMTGVPPEVFPMSLMYLRIYLIGLPVIFLYNFESAIFRSQGDTKTPLICLSASGVLNVLLNLLFVCVFKMAAGGVALATVISNIVSSSLLFVFLTKRSDSIRVTPAKLRLHFDELRSVVRIGLPAGLQHMVFSVSNILIQAAVNSLGAKVMAASAAAFNIEILSYFFVSAIGQACTTFVGQNYGAGNIARCRRITKICMIINICVAIIVSTIIDLSCPYLLLLFNSDPEIISLSIIRVYYLVTGEFISAVMEIFAGAMCGYGYSLVPSAMMFIGVCGTRITWIYTVFRRFHSFSVLMSIYPLSWLATAIALGYAYYRFFKTKRYQTL